MLMCIYISVSYIHGLFLLLSFWSILWCCRTPHRKQDRSADFAVRENVNLAENMMTL